MPIFSQRDTNKLQDLCAAAHKEKAVRDDLRFSQLLLEHIVSLNVLEGITDDIHAGSTSRPHSAPFLTYTRAFAEGTDAAVLMVSVSEQFKPYAKRKDMAAVPNKDSTAYCFETTVADLELPGLDRLIELRPGFGEMPVRKLFKRDRFILDMLNAALGVGFRVKKEEEEVASMGCGPSLGPISEITLVEVRLSVEFVGGSYPLKDIVFAAGISRFSSVARAIQDLPNVSIGFNEDYEHTSVLWPDSLEPHWLHGSGKDEALAGAFDIKEEISEAEKEFIANVIGEGGRL